MFRKTLPIRRDVRSLRSVLGAAFDPEDEEIMPNVSDPEDDEVMPNVSDPEDEEVMPNVSDPGGRADAYALATQVVLGLLDRLPGSSAGSYAGKGCGCAADPCAGADPATEARQTPPEERSGFVIVRMAPEVVSETARSLWELVHEEGFKPNLDGLKTVLELPGEEREEEDRDTTVVAQGAAQQAIRQVAQAGAQGLGRSRRRRGKKGHDRTPEDGDSPEVEAPILPEPDDVLVSRPLIELPRDPDPEREGPVSRKRAVQIVRAFEETASRTQYPPRNSLVAYWRLDCRAYPDLLDEVVRQLSLLREVDLAYPERTARDPKANGANGGSMFADDQGYLDDAPVGIAARWAREQVQSADPGADQVRIIDMEQGWFPKHDELAEKLDDPNLFVHGANREDDAPGTGHHGTAVLGQLAAKGAGHGVLGAAAEWTRLQLASHYKSKEDEESKGEPHPFAGTNGHVASAIFSAIASGATVHEDQEVVVFDAIGPLTHGDVLLLEVQRGRLPTEIEPPDFDAIRLATALGVIVVEAAGNGGFDLDSVRNPEGRLLRRGGSGSDSGAIVVGAARAHVPHDRATSSNYGSRLDCYAWGERVTTCGYGDLEGTSPTDSYTNTFSGTSSASPIIAGAAALVQILHLANALGRLGPRDMRAVLSNPDTGTRQGSGVPGFIGVMPNLKTIVEGELQLVPDLYFRKSLCDDGSPRRKDDEISSSPDLFVRPGPSSELDEPSGEPAPGEAIAPGSQTVYARLRNRGLGTGSARVVLFASPAATLITPERWTPLGSSDAKDVPQGDTPQTSAVRELELVPDPRLKSSPLSLLAVLQPAPAPDAPQPSPYSIPPAVLPPGPPYFDWAAYRSFLRGPGVAWRNVHRVQANDPVELSFYFAGTPDRARHFDFEVIQRLPEGSKVTLEVLRAFASKLRQVQPLIQEGSASSGRTELVWPLRPYVTVERVKLAPCAYTEAIFRVSGATLEQGHSLAIRQVWRGEEVGRITWWFVP